MRAGGRPKSGTSGSATASWPRSWRRCGRGRRRWASMAEPRPPSRRPFPVLSVGGTRRPELARDLVRLDVEEDVEGLRTLHRAPPGRGRRGPAQRRRRRAPGRATTSTSASGCRCRSARPATSGSCSPGRSRRLRCSSPRATCPVVVLRRGRADAAAADPAQRRPGSTPPTPTSPPDRPPARPDPAGRGRRAHLRRRPAVQPAATSRSCASGRAGSRPRCGPPTGRCTSPPATSGRAPRDA